MSQTTYFLTSVSDGVDGASNVDLAVIPFDQADALLYLRLMRQVARLARTRSAVYKVSRFDYRVAWLTLNGDQYDPVFVSWCLPDGEPLGEALDGSAGLLVLTEAALPPALRKILANAQDSAHVRTECDSAEVYDDGVSFEALVKHSSITVGAAQISRRALEALAGAEETP